MACWKQPLKAQALPRSLLEKELESVGIRLNKHKPNIYFKVCPDSTQGQLGDCLALSRGRTADLAAPSAAAFPASLFFSPRKVAASPLTPRSH